MTSREKIKRIVIIHEHKIIREGLQLLVERRADFTVVAQASNCAKAMESVYREQPHILLIDADLLDSNSIEFLPTLIAVSPKSRVLILTGERETESHRQAIQFGVSGLFHKDQGSDILIKAIEKIIEGEVWFETTTKSADQEELRQNNLDDEKETLRINSLTRREREVISVFCHGLKTSEIADRLYISEKTVRNHFASIFRKLSVSHRLELLVYVKNHRLE